MRRMVLITFMAFITSAMAQENPDFEAELKLLETNQLKTEELQMYNADAVTNVIPQGLNDEVKDEVATGQAALKKEPAKEQEASRVRRIRAR